MQRLPCVMLRFVAGSENLLYLFIILGQPKIENLLFKIFDMEAWEQVDEMVQLKMIPGRPVMDPTLREWHSWPRLGTHQRFLNQPIGLD